MNVSSQHLVDKLGLKPVKHPKPYNVNWIDDISKQVTHQVLLSFFLGKNCLEEVWYDVMPMKVGHMRHRTPMALRLRFREVVIILTPSSTMGKPSPCV